MLMSAQVYIKYRNTIRIIIRTYAVNEQNLSLTKKNNPLAEHNNNFILPTDMYIF